MSSKKESSQEGGDEKWIEYGIPSQKSDDMHSGDIKYDSIGIGMSNGKDFKGMNLWGATFRGMDLRGANFTDCCLEYANFRGTTLNNANFEGANLNFADFMPYKDEWGLIVYTDLSGANFNSDTKLHGVNFNLTLLTGAIFEEVDFREKTKDWITKLENAILSEDLFSPLEDE